MDAIEARRLAILALWKAVQALAHTDVSEQDAQQQERTIAATVLYCLTEVAPDDCTVSNLREVRALIERTIGQKLGIA